MDQWHDQMRDSMPADLQAGCDQAHDQMGATTGHMNTDEMNSSMGATGHMGS